jgi:hypothetical protein
MQVSDQFQAAATAVPSTHEIRGWLDCGALTVVTEKSLLQLVLNSMFLFCNLFTPWYMVHCEQLMCIMSAIIELFYVLSPDCTQAVWPTRIQLGMVNLSRTIHSDVLVRIYVNVGLILRNTWRLNLILRMPFHSFGRLDEMLYVHDTFLIRARFTLIRVCKGSLSLSFSRSFD